MNLMDRLLMIKTALMPARVSGNYFNIISRTTSGKKVTADSALKFSTLFACVRNIADDISKLPLHLYKRIEGGKERITSHPIERMLNVQPNQEMSAIDFRDTLTHHLLLWGNAYAYIERLPNRTPVSLWPLRPDKVKPYRSNSDGEIWYNITNSIGGIIPYPNDDILHIRGLGFDGLVGYDVIRYAGESIGAAQAVEEFGSRFFGQGTNIGSTLEHPGSLSDKAYERLKKWVESHEGLAESHKNMILEEGMKFGKNVIPPDAAQFLETRKFSVPEICRWFRMPPHKVADLERATFSNIEEQNIDYVTDCLLTWFIRWEQWLGIKLLDGSPDMFFEHLIGGLLRGNITARYEAYNKARNMGMMNVDEIRAFENLNPLPDKKGQIYLQPLNMVEVGGIGIQALPEKIKRSHPKLETKNLAAFDLIFGDIIDRLARKEAKAVRKAIRRPETFEKWVYEFYAKHIELAERQLEPAIMAYFEMNGIGENAAEIAKEVATKYCRCAIDDLLALKNNENEILALVDKWERGKDYKIDLKIKEK